MPTGQAAVPNHPMSRAGARALLRQGPWVDRAARIGPGGEAGTPADSWLSRPARPGPLPRGTKSATGPAPSAGGPRATPSAWCGLGRSSTSPYPSPGPNLGHCSAEKPTQLPIRGRAGRHDLVHRHAGPDQPLAQLSAAADGGLPRRQGRIR
jgi:hypothetical protein